LQYRRIETADVPPSPAISGPSGCFATTDVCEQLDSKKGNVQELFKRNRRNTGHCLCDEWAPRAARSYLFEYALVIVNDRCVLVTTRSTGRSANVSEGWRIQPVDATH
jgi:hypothetical protein